VIVLICKPVKVTLNVRIVVVGASEVGLSFLETFAFWFETIHSIHFHSQLIMITTFYSVQVVICAVEAVVFLRLFIEVVLIM